ncbi:MAG: hypothetical protein IJ856_07180 [Candidatus Methanomethylophilaceae archaeon]|nr:hypothetical protein [Candidatus Methanomethylophilaceae archaeon]
MNGIFDTLMLLCFLAAWPTATLKALRTKSNRGVSLPFMVIIEVGYICGMVNKVVNDSIDYVIVFYLINFAIVLVNIGLYFWYGRDRSGSGSGAA